MKIPPEFDVVIIGGGMVGATLAFALRESQYRVALVETHSLLPDASPGFDDRSSALSLGSRLILDACDIWSLLADDIEPILRIIVSDCGVWGCTRLSAQELNVDALGYVIENRCFGQRVFRQIHATRNIKVLHPASLTHIETHQDCLHLTLAQDGQVHTVKTRLLVAADGANSTVRALFKVRASSTSYKQTAVITNVIPQRHHHNIAYERFTNSGPVAFLPMRSHQQQSRCSVIWTVPSEEAESMMMLPDNSFLEQLQYRFGYRLGRLLKAGKRSAYPLSLTYSEQSGAERTVFIGNAMQTLHPVAGQGFNLGLRDVFVLRNMLLAKTRDVDIGHAYFLRQYAALRSADRKHTLRFTDNLVRFFSNASGPLGFVRGLGLVTVDSFPWVRQELAHFNMGLTS